MRSLGYGVVVLSTFLWGTTFAAIKLLLGELTPFPILVLRFAIGLIAYSVILAILHGGLPAFPRYARRRLLFVALAGSALNSLGVFFAVSFLGAGISSLVIMLVPVLTGLLAFLAGQERLTARKVQGFAVALTGLIIVVLWGGPEAPFADAKLIGLLLMIFGALGFAIYNVFSKPLFVHYSPVEVTSYIGLLASLSVVPFLFHAPFRDDLSAVVSLSTQGWLIVLYIAVCSSVGANLGWYWALRRLEATRVALFSYLIPVWGLTSSALLLREIVTWWLPVGVALVVAGIVLANRRPRAEPVAAQPEVAQAGPSVADPGAADDAGDVGIFGSPDWLVLAEAVEGRSAASLASWSRRTADAESAEVLAVAAARARDRAFRLRRAARDRGRGPLARQVAGRGRPHPNPLPEGEGTLDSLPRGETLQTAPRHDGSLEVPSAGEGASAAPLLEYLQQILDRPGLYEGISERRTADPTLTDLLGRLRESERVTRQLLEEQRSRLAGERQRHSIRRLAGEQVQRIGAGGSAGQVVWQDGVGGPSLVQVAQAPETCLRLAPASQTRLVALLGGQGLCRPIGNGTVGAPLQAGRLIEIAAGADAEILAIGDWPLRYLIVGPGEALIRNG